MSAIRAYERPLAERLTSGLEAIPGVTLKVTRAEISASNARSSWL